MYGLINSSVFELLILYSKLICEDSDYMKVLISTDFYKNNLGGVTSSVLALCAGLRHYGHEVKVLALSENTRSYQEGDDYLLGSIPAYYAPDMRLGFNIHDPLIKELIQWQPDIIHVQSEGSALTIAKKIQKEVNAPLIMTSHTDYAYFVFGEFKNKALIEKISALVGELFYQPAYKIIVPSKKALSFSFLQPYKDRLIVVPNGIELEKYQKTLSEDEVKQLKKDLGIPSNNRIISAITRLSKEKNIQELIDYLPDLLEVSPDITFMIVGDGPYRTNLETMVEKIDLQEHVVFTGRVPFNDIWRYLAMSDIFVSASVFEVHSMSYLEALAQGLPLLCREDDALDGVLEHGINGYVYNAKEEFVEYGNRILKDDGLSRKLKEGSMQKASTFSSEKFAEAMIAVYEDVIKQWNEEDDNGKVT